MTDIPEEPRDGVQASITGTVSGQVAVGKGITQMQSLRGAGVSKEDLVALREAFALLRSRVEAEAPIEKKGAALERLHELEEAVTAAKPEPAVMEYVKLWFGKNLPKIAGAVASVLLHPAVGTLVGMAGEAVAQEYKRVVGNQE